MFGVRIKADLKREFTVLVKENGLSTCLVVEALLHGWIEGFKVAPASMVNQSHEIVPVVINQKFERVVKRGRRDFKEFIPEPNFYNKEATIWEYKDVEMGELAANGHAPGCGCSECRH